VRIHLLFIALTACLSSLISAQPPQPNPKILSGASLSVSHFSEESRLEHEKFEYQKVIEQQKLEVERLKAWSTGGSIFIPLLLGVFTVYWQSRMSNKLKDRETRDLFDLKAAEILFKTDSTVGAKNRARALNALFPGRFPNQFGEDFQPSQFGGPKFEAQLEVFKAACSKVSSADEVYQIWKAIFPGDKWIEPLLTKSETIEHSDDAT